MSSACSWVRYVKESSCKWTTGVFSKSSCYWVINAFENLGRWGRLQSSADQRRAPSGLVDALLPPCLFPSPCVDSHHNWKRWDWSTFEGATLSVQISSEILWRAAFNKEEVLWKSNVKEITIYISQPLHGRSQERMEWVAEVSPAIYYQFQRRLLINDQLNPNTLNLHFPIFHFKVVTGNITTWSLF